MLIELLTSDFEDINEPAIIPEEKRKSTDGLDAWWSEAANYDRRGDCPTARAIRRTVGNGPDYISVEEEGVWVDETPYRGVTPMEVEEARQKLLRGEQAVIEI